jgi:hypothetical protein
MTYVEREVHVGYGVARLDVSELFVSVIFSSFRLDKLTLQSFEQLVAPATARQK